MSNRPIFEDLLARRAIEVRPGELFSRDPGSRRHASSDRVAGMMLGLAIGDALGNTSEGLFPRQRAARYGEIRDYLPNRYAENRPVGLPSDDTQLAAWTLEQLVEDGGYVPENLARRICSGRIFGIGSTVREFVRNHKDLGKPWHSSGPRSAGNGALMRIAPMLFPHLRTGSSDLWIDTALSGMTTHNDTASISSCLAFVAILWDLLALDEPPRAEWWLQRFIEVASASDSGAAYTPRGGRYENYRGPFTAYVEMVVSDAHAHAITPLEAANAWHSGAFLLETVPSVLYILMCHGDDPEEAIIRAVNDTKDNDTVAAIVGAAVGALHGARALPARWVDGLLGRTAENDDGHFGEILAAAKAAFLD